MSFIYKTTNLINGKIYIGQHSNNCPSYLGSGVKFNSAIKHHGKENFEREILHDNITTQKALDALEKHYIKKHDSCNPAVGYNILAGSANGFGQCNPMDNPEIKERCAEINRKTCSNEDYRKRQSEIMTEYFKTHDACFKGMKHSEETKATLSNSRKEYYKTHSSSFKGKNHTEETKNILSSLATGKRSGKDNGNFGNRWSKEKKEDFSKFKSEQYKGEGNPRFGKYWVNNGVKNSSVDKGSPVPEGWKKGFIRVNKV